MQTPSWIACVLALGTLAAARGVLAGQPLETESTRLIPAHRFEVELGCEVQSSSFGRETTLPFALGYGITDRLELLVEPVPYTSIHDPAGVLAHGQGDLEVTLTSRVRVERPRAPALALAAEIKLPVAESPVIGSDKTDVTAWLIASKQAGRWDTHANLGYTWVGKPPGADVQNVYSFGLAEEFRASRRWELVGEVYGSTAALAESNDAGPGGESSLTPEIGGAETVGALGVRLRVPSGLVLSLGVSYDNQQALLVHPGLAVTF